MSATDWDREKTDELNALGWTLFDIDGVEYPDRTKPDLEHAKSGDEVTVYDPYMIYTAWITVDADGLAEVLQ